jgi:hypothetical protein
MKGIYLTQEGKQEIESKIAELEEENKFPVDKWEEGKNQGKIYILEEILSSATILPVEESWNLSVVAITPFKQGLLKTLYKNGVIIQPNV